jgi:hypothetical protein
MKKLVCENLIEYESLNEGLMTDYLNLDKSDEQRIKKFALDLVCKTYSSGAIWKYSKSYNFFQYMIDNSSITKILGYLRDAAFSDFRGKTVLKYEDAGQNRMKKFIAWSK